MVVVQSLRDVVVETDTVPSRQPPQSRDPPVVEPPSVPALLQVEGVVE